jgi:hypothetical protein
MKAHGFLFSYPSHILSQIGFPPKAYELAFTKIIEAAPFYLRATAKNTAELSGTIEFLIPKRIKAPLNQKLMSTRQFTLHEPYPAQRPENFTFSQISKKITKYNGRSFYFASFILNAKNRAKAYFIYALCRLIDDATDEVQTPLLALGAQGSAFSSALLELLWNKSALGSQDFFSQLQEKLSFCTYSKVSLNASQNFVVCSQELIAQMKLEKSYFLELLAGQKMDESFEQPKSFPELYLYCFRVAGVVGLMMTRIFSIPENNSVKKAAEHMGIAMQITNNRNLKLTCNKPTKNIYCFELL